MYIISRRSSTHSNQSFHPNLYTPRQSINQSTIQIPTFNSNKQTKKMGSTYHPIPTLIHLISHNIDMYSLRRFKIPLPHRLRQLNHTPYSILFQQVLVIEMVEEDIETFLCVVDLGFEGGGGFGFHALHVVGENFVDGAGGRGDMGAVSGGWVV